MPDGPVVVDNTPLVAFWALGRLDLIESLFGEILIPQAVYEEFVATAPEVRARALSSAPWIRVQTLDEPRRALAYAGLDRGEAEVIALAEQRDARLVIVDDKRARHYARRLGFPLTGTLGVLLLAKEGVLIGSVTRERSHARRKPGSSWGPHSSRRPGSWQVSEATEGAGRVGHLLGRSRGSWSTWALPVPLIDRPESFVVAPEVFAGGRREELPAGMGAAFGRAASQARRRSSTTRSLGALHPGLSDRDDDLPRRAVTRADRQTGPSAASVRSRPPLLWADALLHQDTGTGQGRGQRDDAGPTGNRWHLSGSADRPSHLIWHLSIS